MQKFFNRARFAVAAAIFLTGAVIDLATSPASAETTTVVTAPAFFTEHVTYVEQYESTSGKVTSKVHKNATFRLAKVRIDAHHGVSADGVTYWTVASYLKSASAHNGFAVLVHGHYVVTLAAQWKGGPNHLNAAETDAWSTKYHTVVARVAKRLGYRIAIGGL